MPTSPNEQKPRIRYNKPNHPPTKLKGALTKKAQEAVKLSAEYEIPADQAYQLVAGRLPERRMLERIEQQVEKWSLKHPQALKAASKTIKNFAQGLDVNGIKPNASTVLAASQRIVDASEPIVKRSENVNLNIQADPVDLSKYRR